MRFKAAIFDMDGLLIDSEKCWQQAEVEILNGLGVPLRPDWCFQTVGLQINEAIGYWFDRYPWKGESVESVASRVVARVRELVDTTADLMPGARQAMEVMHAQTGLLAIATSSRMALVEGVVAKFGLDPYFAAYASAQDLSYGKPHPGVYLKAAEMLGVEPRACLAFEDSVNGLISSKAARMFTVAVPYPEWRDDPRLAIADCLLDSLEQVTAEWFAGINRF